MTNSPGISVVALVLIERDGEILLVRQGYGECYWSLPGGAMEAGESIDQAAVREVREETGLEIGLGRVVGIYSKPDENGLAVSFEGSLLGVR